MTTDEAALAKIVPEPRLPVNRLMELRAFIDVLLASSVGDSLSQDGGSNAKTNADGAGRVVRKCAGGKFTTSSAGTFSDAAAPFTARSDYTAHGNLKNVKEGGVP